MHTILVRGIVCVVKLWLQVITNISEIQGQIALHECTGLGCFGIYSTGNPVHLSNPNPYPTCALTNFRCRVFQLTPGLLKLTCMPPWKWCLKLSQVISFFRRVWEKMRRVVQFDILCLLASFPGLPCLQFLIACSMQKRRRRQLPMYRLILESRS